MVQPIQYTPQFIKTDVGAIQDKLNARQGQYDTAYAGTLGAEDQFGQFQVHQKDVDLKNKVIGGFKDRVKNLVDQYGGDYAAASKQLVKEIVNTKQDKFFGLAAERNRLAEEQRRLVQQYGPNAIVLKDVTKPDLMDAQGNYIRPEDLQSDVINREQVEQMLDKTHGGLKTAVNYGEFRQAQQPWLIERNVTEGINNNQVLDVADKMYNTIMQSTPEMDKNTAKQIALDHAKSYVQGTKIESKDNEAWKSANNISNEKDLYLWKKNIDIQDAQKLNDIKHSTDKANFLKQDRSRMYNVTDPQFNDYKEAKDRLGSKFVDKYTGNTYNNPIEANIALNKYSNQVSGVDKEIDNLKKLYNVNILGIPIKRDVDKQKYISDQPGWLNEQSNRQREYDKYLGDLEFKKSQLSGKYESLKQGIGDYALSDSEYGKYTKLLGLKSNAPYSELKNAIDKKKLVYDEKITDLNATNSAGNTLKNDMLDSFSRYSSLQTKNKDVKDIYELDNSFKEKGDPINQSKITLMKGDKSNIESVSFTPESLQNGKLVMQDKDGKIYSVPPRYFGSQVDNIMNGHISDGKGHTMKKSDYYKELVKRGDTQAMTEFENSISEEIANAFNYNFYQMQGNTAK